MDYKQEANRFLEAMFKNGKKRLVDIPNNCSQGETGALFYLTFVENNVSASRLSEKLNVSMPRIVSLINSLEKKELIIKKQDKEDKRKIIITITENGKNIILNKKEEAVYKISKIIECLGEEEYNEYIRLLKKINKIIDENNL